METSIVLLSLGIVLWFLGYGVTVCCILEPTEYASKLVKRWRSNPHVILFAVFFWPAYIVMLIAENAKEEKDRKDRKNGKH